MIEVTLLLSGGHLRTLWMDESDPILSEIVGSVANKAAGGKGIGVYNIIFEERNRSLILAGTDIIGLVTNPPLEVGADKPHEVQQEFESHYLLENFLGERECSRLFDVVESRRGKFASSEVDGCELNIRHSQVLYDIGDFGELVVRKIAYVFPLVLDRLGLPAQRINEIEYQITAHNNQDFYKLHCDLTSESQLGKKTQRLVSFVYYFYCEPRAFTGGQLRFSRYQPEQIPDETLAMIDPKNNSIVFFRSTLYHEVLPVTCPTQSFSDGRFTFNGWVRCE